MRKRLASLSFSEKIKVLEKLRDRSLAIAGSGLRRRTSGESGEASERRFCACLGWEPCACGNQPPYHCVRCRLELSAEQIAAAKRRGWYSKKEK